MTIPTSFQPRVRSGHAPLLPSSALSLFGLDGLYLLGPAASSRPRPTAAWRSPLDEALSPFVLDRCNPPGVPLSLFRSARTTSLVDRATRKFRAHFTGAGIYSIRTASLTSQCCSPESGWLTTTLRRTTAATLALTRSFGSLDMQRLRRSSSAFRSTSFPAVTAAAEAVAGLRHIK